MVTTLDYQRICDCHTRPLHRSNEIITFASTPVLFPD